MNDNFLLSKLAARKVDNALRQLRTSDGMVDFCSNDYLGMTANRLVETNNTGKEGGDRLHGSTGSRLISGNYPLIEAAEKHVAAFHKSPAGLIFNSGYDANIGLLSSVAQRGDTIVYDYLSHASIRDGIRLSFARSFSFLHNDIEDLEKKLQSASGNIFVVTESVFSMDGDAAPLTAITELCMRYNAQLIVDEAHATGIIGDRGEGMAVKLGLEQQCFARVHTFGKAAGCHGAIVLGSIALRDFLINFSRPFIYTTAMPAAAVMAIKTAYTIFPGMEKERAHLHELIAVFREAAAGLHLLVSDTPIQPVIIPGNESVKKMALYLQRARMDIRPILYPTVPEGKERLRIVLHAFNTLEEIERLAWLLKKQAICH